MSNSKFDLALLGIATLLLAILWGRAIFTRSATSPQNTGLDVQDLVTHLRTELESLDKKRDPNSAGFLRFSEATVEVSFVVKATQSATGSVNFDVVTVGAGSDASREQVQKLSIKLLPMARSGSTPPE